MIHKTLLNVSNQHIKKRFTVLVTPFCVSIGTHQKGNHICVKTLYRYRLHYTCATKHMFAYLYVKQLIRMYRIAYVLVENSWQPSFLSHSAAEFCPSNISSKKIFFTRELLLFGTCKKI